jgi:hypothetical protein
LATFMTHIKVGLSIFATLVMLILIAGGSAYADNQLCTSLGNQLNKPLGLTPFFVEETLDDINTGRFSISSIDIDNDQINDVISLTRTGPGSTLSADSSLLNYMLSSNKKNYRIEAQQISVFRFQTNLFVITSKWLSKEGPIAKNIFELGKDGIQHRCAFNCTSLNECTQHDQ